METPNLSYIEQLSGGDSEFKNKIIQIIKEEFPVEKEEYYNNVENKKLEKVAENVHKLKHKISILGLEKCYKTAEIYEDELRNNDTSKQDEFESILNNITDYLSKI